MKRQGTVHRPYVTTNPGQGHRELSFEKNAPMPCHVESQLPPLPGSFLKGLLLDNPEGNACHLHAAH